MSSTIKTFCQLAWLWAALASAVLAAEARPVQIEPPPAWAEAHELPELSPTPEQDVSRGYDYLLLTRHVNVAEEATSYRTVYRITSEGALQSGGRLTWSYDPIYEQLSLHHVRLIRDGVVQERLTADGVKTIQQERDMDRHILDGHLTAFVLLEDVRVGDVIDYAFTRRGWNPTFGGNYFDAWQTQWAVPVRHQRLRADLPAGEAVWTKAHGLAEVPFETKQTESGVSYVWEARDMRPLDADGEAPSWFDAYGFFQFTAFQQWSDVVRWAEPLYALPAELPVPVREQAERLIAGLESDEEKARALLQFVQQEVRYLGLELGAGSYRPNAPEVVLARRFGDCKDKTLLFCALMRAAGLEAYPALVHTSRRDRIEEWLPTPLAFDHVIACVPQGKELRWVDPTLTQQQGRLDRRGLPDYRRALVILRGSDRPVAVELPENARSSVRIEERFDMKDFESPARFQVTTRFTGVSADATRRYFARTTLEQISKDYVNYYTTSYPGLTVAGPVTWADDRENNVVTSVEVYEVPGLWKKEDDGLLKAEFFPRNISDYAVRPQTAVRTHPLGLAHPVDVELVTVTNLPETWSVNAEETVTEDEAFRATTGIEGEGKVVRMRYTWQTKTDHVQPERMPEYLRKLNTFRDSLGYSLTYRAPTTGGAGGETVSAGPYRVNWLLVLVTLVTATLGMVAAVKVARWQPSTPPPILAESSARLSGLGGWLILVGFGVTIRPVILGVSVVKTMGPSFDLGIWESVTLVGRATYQAGLGPLIICEMIGNTLLVVISVLAVVLFYGKKRAFPATFVVMMVLQLLLVFGDMLAVRMLLEAGPEAEQVKEIGEAIQGVIAAAIWIPYMLVSRRVKATFTR